LRPTTRIFIFQLNACDYSPYVPSCLMRGWVCRLQLLLIFASAVIFMSESRGTHDHILLSQIRGSPVFIFPRNRVAQLYPQALGSLFVASYDSQGYGGGIRPRLHTGGSHELVAPDHPGYNISALTVQKTPFLCCCTIVAFASVGVPT
jgi:hypothetical protein